VPALAVCTVRELLSYGTNPKRCNTAAWLGTAVQCPYWRLTQSGQCCLGPWGRFVRASLQAPLRVGLVPAAQCIGRSSGAHLRILCNCRRTRLGQANDHTFSEVPCSGLHSLIVTIASRLRWSCSMYGISAVSWHQMICCEHNCSPFCTVHTVLNSGQSSQYYRAHRPLAMSTLKTRTVRFCKAC
jgi:hypothetical protein